VSCLCPNAVYTGMFGRPDGDKAGAALMPEDVAGAVLKARSSPGG
jgi:hypothetical protein